MKKRGAQPGNKNGFKKGVISHIPTKEEREKLRKRMKESNPMKNPIVREKMRASKKGIKLSEEHLQKLRGRPAWNKGLVGFRAGERIKDRNLLKTSEKKHLDTRYREWMFSVKRRDGWKCRIENSDCKGRLESHHILAWRDYPELRYQINNGITLCQFHHPRKRKDEEKLSPYFQKLVAEKQ